MAVILGIESSCDETSGAVCYDGKILNNIIALQSVHEKYGGVVPELASRAHQSNIVPVVKEALSQAGFQLTDIDAVSVTSGPGLLGSLLVGLSFAKGLGLALDVPLIGVNHMQAHVLAHFIDDPKPQFPFLCLTVSGGHTQLLIVRGYFEMEEIGRTRDDAVGEAFDKTAKLMGLPYPGGPVVDRLAAQGNPHAFEFPGADVPELDFSFSGIKTALLYFLRDHLRSDEHFIAKHQADICASIQHQLLNMLFEKLEKAVSQTGITEVAIAGGVSANSELRKRLEVYQKERGWNVHIPDFQYCTDNAAMIAITGYYAFLEGKVDDLSLSAEPRLSI